ncbi:MAG: pro-sigmaK processing inhibitor BofA family protein [Candidatus Micrarchaeota archaeon]|nr:pro-sigmaK processing inhibitor BofA family protein [Candidatus Micrarchaeota archaeon]
MSLLPISFGNTLIGEIIVLAIIAVIIYIIFKMGKSLVKLIVGLIANSVLGLFSILLLDYLLGLSIPVTYSTMIPTAIFGLPAVGTLVILRFFGIQF